MIQQCSDGSKFGPVGQRLLVPLSESGCNTSCKAWAGNCGLRRGSGGRKIIECRRPHSYKSTKETRIELSWSEGTRPPSRSRRNC
ncbi:uncharacterized protein LOC119311710 isoform X3 [Triticum dicoccoides]|uniref:uncharacterized protein LOC119311710 isoform X3 n=1 Tax=Triticum dicoccoides TaxID=85692 RepID=UPI001891BD20|nr:uncharacterized protein LOC119311710 isoform X3 [Triticum dicoccoides]